MKKKLVLKEEVKEDLLDLGFVMAGLLFIYLFILLF